MFGYIERTYVGRYKTNKKNEMKWKKPRYEIKCWNVRERVLLNLPKIQNKLTLFKLKSALFFPKNKRHSIMTKKAYKSSISHSIFRSQYAHMLSIPDYKEN